MVKRHIVRYICGYYQKAVCFNVYNSSNLKIHRVQDVFEPWLAPNEIYE